MLRPSGPAPDGGHVWQFIDSSTIGGIEKHIAVLTASLLRTGIPTEIVLYQDHGANPWLAQLADAGLGYRHLDGTAGGLLRAMRASRPPLVHTHGYKAGVLGRLAAARLAIPSVSTFHMGERPRYPVSLYDTVDRYSALLSHGIAVSDAIARSLPFSSTVVRNWIDIPSEAPAFPEPPAKSASSVGSPTRRRPTSSATWRCGLPATVTRGTSSAMARCATGSSGRPSPRDGMTRRPRSRRSGRACRSSPQTSEMSLKWWSTVRSDGWSAPATSTAS